MTSANDVSIGLSAYGLSPRQSVELGVAAEAAGFSSYWLGEHLVVPMGHTSRHPSSGEVTESSGRSVMDPMTPLADPMMVLSALAERTSNILLGTAIHILPLRSPLHTARMAATLAELTGNRFRLGVGSGWLTEEFRALGVPFAERQSRFRESVEILRKAFAGGPFSYSGIHWDTGTIQMSSAPVAVPLILGGNSDHALRRAAQIGDGWFSSGTPTFDDACRLRDKIMGHVGEVGRDSNFRVYMRIKDPTECEVERYRAAGFDHLVLWADAVCARPLADGGDEWDLTAAATRLGLDPTGPVGRADAQPRT